MVDSERGEKASLIVGLGASAGGLDACMRVLAEVPAKSGIAFIVILHLDPSRVSHLAQVLESRSALPVVQVNEAVSIEPDHVYVIAPNTSLTVADGELRPDRPLKRVGTGSGVIDLLFSSLAEAHGSGAVAVVLSGIGSDGTSGLADIKAAGGLCIAQDPATAEQPAMPRSAIATGQVDAVLSPEAIPAYLLGHGLVRAAPIEPAQAEEGEGDEKELAGFEGVLHLLAIHHGFEARDYKKGTLRRRAQRRLAMLPFTGWSEYLLHVQEHPEELAALYQDVLIGVTQFFRDPEQWEYLGREIIPALLDEHRGKQESIRIWSAGCATGEEAYSLAMVFLEQLEAKGSQAKLHVFATDVSQKAISFARQAVYPATIAEQVSPGRLSQFFSKRGDSYQVESRVRDMVTFAQHDLLSQPPFSHLDLVSCRNLFIYLEPHAQRACIERFHFALRPKGVLWLGGAETVNRQSDLFTTLSAKYRMYRKSEAHRASMPSWNARMHLPLGFIAPVTNRAATQSATTGAEQITRSIERYLLEHLVTACVVINEAGNVLHMFGPIASYLTPPVGEVRLDLLSWVNEASLYAKLRSALERSIARRERVEVAVQLRRGTELVCVEVSIEPIPSVDEGLFLVAFRDKAEPAPAAEPDAGAGDEALVRRLTTQLQEVQAELQGALEALDNANEEYRASYEELVSLNEELQSSNEELETTKEEAQSINEELLTINRELEERNETLRMVNADLENLLVLTTIPMVFLDRQLRVRRYTPAAERVMWLVSSDVGRPLQHIQKRIDDDRMLDDAAKVLEELVPIEVEARADDGRWYLRKIVPFRAGDRIDGVCITFYDITAQKLAAEQSEEARYFAESIVRSSKQPFVVFDHQLTVVSANEVFYETFATSKGEVEGMGLDRLCDGAWDIPRLRELLEGVLRSERGADEAELEHRFERLGLRYLRLTASLLDRPGRTPLVLLSIEDVTQLRETQRVAARRTEEHELEHRRKDEFLAMLGHELRNPLATLVSGLALIEQIGTDPEQLRKIQPMLVRQTRRMSVMLDQLLDISRVSSGKILLDMEVVDLVDVAEAAIEAVQPLITMHEHELIRSMPERGTLFVNGDFVRLVQVVENLVANAAKYTDDRGTIWLTLEVVDESARIIVRDTGIGIEEELLPQVFELFTQGTQRVGRSKGGLGLGLPLVRQLVNMHGGQVEAHSAGPGQGSEFVVLLPRLGPKMVSQREHQYSEAELGAVPPLRVLVVDDEPDSALALAELLDSLGHEVQTAFDGHGALAAVESFEPELVLLDLGLPDMDGYEVATQLREWAKPGMRLVAVTGYSRDDDRLREAGFDDHLIKPPIPARLAMVLSAAARARR